MSNFKMSLDNQVEELSTELISLRKEILIMKALIKQQNSMLKDLSQAKPSKKSNAHKAALSSIPDNTMRFPLQLQADLDSFEASINEENEEEIIAEIRYLVGAEGLAKNLSRILSTEIVISYNLTGLHNKGRLQDYPKLLDVLFKASIFAENEHPKFIEDLRNGFKFMKQRHFKNISMQRKKEYESVLKTSDPLKKDIKRIKTDDESFN